MLQIKQGILRPWQDGDQPWLVRYLNNKNVWDNLRDLMPHPYTKEDADFWIKLTGGKKPAQDFAIEVDGKVVGGISVVRKDDVYRKNLEIGYWLSEEFWGGGIMTQAVNAIVEYSFRNFDVIRIYAGIFSKNHASARVLEKCGFTKEAVLKSAIIKNDEILDEWVYSILRSE